MFKVSVEDQPGDRFKLRWREYTPVLGEDGKPLQKRGKVATTSRARSFTVEGKKARDETRADIIAALRATGVWTPPTAPAPRLVCNLERASVAWLAFKATRCKASSVDRYTGEMARWFRALRQVRGLRADQVVTADLLDRDTYVATVRQLQLEELAAGTVYGTARSALDMWVWTADDPKAYPGVHTPPRSSKAILPRPPRYRSSTAPTIAELDACLRHMGLRALRARRAGILMRFTGLRIFQVVEILREDVDLEERTILVRMGKSAGEEASARTIPISPHLLAELDWVRKVPVGQPIITPRKGAHRMNSATEQFTGAWKRATEAGEVRERVWKPANRRNARPEHAFRAGLQAFWRQREVEEAVIDALVGHEPDSTRDKHYAGDALLEKMRRAVEMLPGVEWRIGRPGTADPGAP